MSRFGKIEGVPTVSGNRVHASVRVSSDLEPDVNLVVPYGVTYDIADLDGAPVMLLETANNDSAGLVLGYLNSSTSGAAVALKSDVVRVENALKNSSTGVNDGGALYKTNITAALGGGAVGSNPVKVS